MYKFYLKPVLIGAGLLLVGCERSSLSPVEIKIDDDSGYTRVDAAVSGSTLMTTHIVKNNETLFDVAYKYNIDPMNLAKVNGIKAPYNIRNGQILKLPTEETPAAENEMLDYGDGGAKSENNKMLDDEFAGVMATKGGIESGKSNKTGTSFNEQAAALSVPKVTKTATGAEVSEKKASAEEKVPAVTPVATKSSKFMRPTEGNIISKFGDMQDGVPNDGINIKANLGTSVKAAADGKVIYTGDRLGEEFGNVILVQHDNDLITSYAHLDKIAKKNGARVRCGEVLGTVGKTGDVSSPQLHFEVLKDKKPVDPMKYIK